MSSDLHTSVDWGFFTSRYGTPPRATVTAPPAPDAETTQAPAAPAPADTPTTEVAPALADTGLTDPGLTGPAYWARARVPRPPVTRSRTGITVSPYQFAPDEQIGTPEMLRNVRMAAPGLVRTANEILDIEGPMPLQRLITLLARRFGIPRLDPQRRYHMARVVSPQFRLVDDFAWPAGMKPATWRTARRVGDPADRRISDISREELANAMEFVLGSDAAPSRDELFARTADLLGYPKIPGPQQEWVESALDRAIAAGRFRQDAEGIRIS